MVNFANITDAWTKKQKSGSREKTSSHSSSSSLRIKRDSKKVNYQSGGAPPYSEYNQNYQVQSTIPAYSGTGLHPYKESTNSDQKSTFDELMGIDVIKKVMKNDWCKKILRNILLEEYLDGMIGQRINQYQTTTMIQNGGSNGQQVAVNEAVETDWLSEKYFGVELRTILMVILGIIVLKYFFRGNSSFL